MKAATPFKQTYSAPFNPFKPPVPRAKYERNIGDNELGASPVELLAEKVVERYGGRLSGKRLVIHEFTYALEQVISKPQGMIFIPLDPASAAIAVVGSIAGTAMMRGKGIDLKLSVKIDAELDGTRIEALERPMSLGMTEDAPERITRDAIEKFLYRFESAQPVTVPAETKAAEETKATEETR